MSLLPELGHLYHDSAIKNSSVILDAKEFLRTREINAREQRHLDSLSKYLDRAKSAGQRVRDHEKWSVRERLRSLQIKTPTLAKGLRKETQRQQRLRNRFGVSEENLTYLGCSPLSSVYYAGPTYYPAGSPWTRHRQMSRTKSKQIGLPPRISEHQGSQNNKTQPTYSPSLYVSSFKIKPESRPQILPRRETKNKFIWKKPPAGRPSLPESTNFVKRAEQVVKSLHKLYTRLLEREETQRGVGLEELLDSDTKELLERARMVLGQDAIDDLMAVHRTNPPMSDVNDDIRDLTSSVPSDKLKGDKRFSILDGQDAHVLQAVDIIKETTDKFTVEFVEESRPLPWQNKSGSIKFGELFNASPERRSKRNFEDSDVRVSSWVTSTIANRRLGDVPRNASAVEKSWSEITPYQALWQQNSRNREVPRKHKTRTLVTLAGKQRKTLIYR